MKAFVKRNYPYILIVLIAIFIRSFLFVVMAVEGPSMEPTLKSGQIMILNKTAYLTKKPERFDMVVVKVNNISIVKRIIGLPGETVNYQNNKLYINKKHVLVTATVTPTADFRREVRVPINYYFIMGDNRSESADSRVFGSIKESQIIGQTNFSLIPFKKY